MIQSENINELAKALGAFQAVAPTIGEDGVNTFFNNSSYATLAKIIQTAGGLLPEHGLSVTQITEGGGAVTTILMHTSGQYIGGTLELNPKRDDPQGRGSAITYARRYSYASILGLVTDKDDDGTAASKKASKTKPQAASQPTQAQAKQKLGDDLVEEFANGGISEATLELAKTALIAKLIDVSNDLGLHYNSAAVDQLIHSAMKSLGYPAKLTTLEQIDETKAVAIGALGELATKAG